MTEKATSGGAPSKVRIGVVLAVIAGLAAATAVIGWVGFRAVLSALALIGAKGLIFLVVYGAVPATLQATAWFVLATPSPANRWRKFLFARVVRNAAGDVLPFTQLGGFVIGARAAVLQGISAGTAAATTIVDVTTEFIAQLGFAALGIAMLAAKVGPRSMHATLLGATLAGLALSMAAAAAFVILQRKAPGLVERLAGRFAPGLLRHVGQFGRDMDRVYERPVSVGIGVVVHLIAWIVGAAGVWFALRFASVRIDLGDVLAIESLVGAVRSAGFVAPMAVGVQEAAYGLIGPIFGLPAEMALAVSLIKRATSLTIGAPALVLWQTLEGRRAVTLARPVVKA